jgi:hypothetical protein
MSTDSNTSLETTSKTFPPLLWQCWPFPVHNGERTEASKALLGVRVKPTQDSFEDFEDATW